MPFSYTLEGVPLDDAPIDGDLADLDALDHLQDGGGLGSGLDALDGILDLGGSPHLRVGLQKVRDGLDERRIFGGTLFGGLGVTACALLIHLHDGVGGELTQFGREGLVGSDGIVEVLSSHSFFVSFLVFKSFVL